MFAIRSLVKNNAQIFKNVAQQRNMSVIAVPPRSKVTKAEMIFLSGVMLVSWCAIPTWVLEMIFLSGVMLVSWCAIPTWVLVNLKHYRGQE
ncbi:hypothetical protein RR48_01465 [Papilio machaon]|uniref:Uncharacterized protein n=1 Tax=Papilio machaon TaxID=76193 RepID=A0A0N0PEM8_PAPMA|nr:hypothetical protein RR48_01465 [Papilio machaon]